MAEPKNYTQAGFNALQDELNFLKNVRRPAIKEEVAKARSYGDLSENSEYDEAKNEEAKIEMRIAELEEMIKVAHVIDESEIDHTKVSVGSVVDVKNEDTAVKKTYHIVGSYET
ncbi:MAG: transcription elongation factor GreA, partial [Clostridia bacterium]|nr:transcription elongation factor GreA [Clostridia bacterium]